jgi:hypothetical protein
MPWRTAYSMLQRTCFPTPCIPPRSRGGGAGAACGGGQRRRRDRQTAALRRGTVRVCAGFDADTAWSVAGADLAPALFQASLLPCVQPTHPRSSRAIPSSEPNPHWTLLAT